jgi:hypothetical protein
MIPEKPNSVQSSARRNRRERRQGSAAVFLYPLAKSLRQTVGDHEIVVQKQGAIVSGCLV